jgi:putative transposase
MVKHPAEYRWSSYRANAEGANDPLLTPHAEYLRLGETGAQRCEAYSELFKAHMDPERITQIRSATNSNYALGTERFKTEIEQLLKRRATPGKSGRPRKAVTIDG